MCGVRMLPISSWTLRLWLGVTGVGVVDSLVKASLPLGVSSRTLDVSRILDPSLALDKSRTVDDSLTLDGSLTGTGFSLTTSGCFAVE